MSVCLYFIAAASYLKRNLLLTDAILCIRTFFNPAQVLFFLVETSTFSEKPVMYDWKTRKEKVNNSIFCFID